MTDYKKYIDALRKCAKEHENDRTFTGHIIVSDLCRDTADLLETLEQEPILDEIRAEIVKLDDINPDYPMDMTVHISRYEVLKIIDKYRVESEDME